MNPSSDVFMARRQAALTGVIVLLAVLSVFTTFRALRLKQTTGVLVVYGQAANAAIGVTADGKSAAYVGTGSVKLRLPAGEYEVAGSSAGTSVRDFAKVQIGQTTTLRLNKTAPPSFPSAGSITFTGTEGLVAQGISTQQITGLKNMFFSYQKTAKTITIDTGSIHNGPHDPRNDNQPFTLNFTGTIDGKAYRATVTYSDTENLLLTINDPVTGATLFNGTSLPPAQSVSPDS